MVGEHQARSPDVPKVPTRIRARRKPRPWRASASELHGVGAMHARHTVGNQLPGSALILSLTLATVSAACSSPPAKAQESPVAAPLRLRFHHEPGGRIFIIPTPRACYLSAHGSELDECDIPATDEILPEYILQAHPHDPAWVFNGWKITTCGSPATVLQSDTIRFHPLDSMLT
jgi:hypothetical protein